MNAKPAPFRYTLHITNTSGQVTSEHVFGDREELRRQLIFVCHLPPHYVSHCFDIAHAAIGVPVDMVRVEEHKGRERMEWSGRLTVTRQH